MRKQIFAAALGLSVGVVPAASVQAQDAALVVGGVLIVAGVAAAAIEGGQPGRGTSQSTQYAMTGQGAPAISTRQEAIYMAFGSDWQRCCSGGRIDPDHDDN